jgi:alanyl-tRNA synthetase
VTQRLYYLDSNLCDFEASMVERGDDGMRIYLDRSAFYPTSGGQPHDTGTIEGIEVTDVVDEGERIAHLLARPLSGGTVRGQVNWPRRLDHMQQHTGQHLLSAVLADLLGHTTVSVHLGEHSSTVDLDAPPLSPEQVARVERRANEVVTENRTVQVSFEEAGSAVRLRKAPTRSGTIRIISIEGLDRSACGGTHVKTTGEIGPILLRKIERARKGCRIEFVCGLRAIRRARREAEVLDQVAGDLSCGVEELPQVISYQRAELKEAAGARRALEAELSLCQAKQLYAEATPDPSGLRRAVVRRSSGTIEELRALAQAFATLPQAVFIGALQSPASILLSAAADSGINAGGVLKGVLALAGGRGGGSAALAQGVLPGAEDLDQVIAMLGGTNERGPAEDSTRSPSALT